MTTTKTPRQSFRITFGFSESMHVPRCTVDGFEAANAILAAAAPHAPAGGAYDKTDVEILHVPTGEVYRLRYDLQRPEVATPDLLARVRTFCDWVANGKREDGSPRYTSESTRRECATWLARFGGTVEPSTTTHDLGNNETASTGCSQQADGSWLALTRTESKSFRTFGGARRWLARRGYAPNGQRL